ncbi:YicC family protein [bacterium]|nr:YicC family protein [bacterium]
MVYSMTGLGTGETQTSSHIIRVEIKSVNNRFLEVSCRLPSKLNQRETAIRDLLRKSLDRGKIYVQVSIQYLTRQDMPFTVNSEAVTSIYSVLDALRVQAGIEAPVSLDHLLKFTEIFDSPLEDSTGDELWPDLEKAVLEALEGLKKMRHMEGLELAADIRSRVELLEKNLAAIEKIAADNPERIFGRLRERVARLLKDSDLDQDRLRMEVAMLAEKSDITEECVRLRSHFQLLEHTLASPEATGKKLNFLVQELNREVNTITSKANDAEVSHLCVDMKGEIEKIREQVQNLE